MKLTGLDIGKFNKESMMMYNKAHMNDMSPAAGSIGQGY